MGRNAHRWVSSTLALTVLWSFGLAQAQGTKLDVDGRPVTGEPRPIGNVSNHSQAIQYQGPIGHSAHSPTHASQPAQAAPIPPAPVTPAMPENSESTPYHSQSEESDRYRTGNPELDAAADRELDDPNYVAPSGSGALGAPSGPYLDGQQNGSSQMAPESASSESLSNTAPSSQRLQEGQAPSSNSGYLPGSSNRQTLEVDLMNPYRGVQDVSPDYLRSQYFDRRALHSQGRLAAAADTREFGALAVGTIGITLGSVSMPIALAAIGAKDGDRGSMARAGQIMNISAGWMLFTSAQLVRSSARLERIAHEPNALTRHRLLQEMKVRDGRMTRGWGTAGSAIGGLLVVGGLILDASRDSRGVCGPFDVCSDDVHLGAMAKAGVSTLAISVPALVSGILMERFATRRLNAMTPEVMLLPTISSDGAGAMLMMNW